MKSILVPVDFSQNALLALDAAGLIAEKTGAKLFVLHSYVPFVPTEINVPSGVESDSRLEDSMKKHLEEYLERVNSKGIEAEAIWTEGAVLKSVVEQAETLKADLVVIGRTGKGGFLDKLFGSVATEIVNKLEDVPVLTVPPESDLKSIQKIVYATKLEHEEDEAIRKVYSIAKQLGAALQFLKLDSLIQPDIQPDHQFIGPLKEEFGLTDEDFVIVDIGRDSIVTELENQAVRMGADILAVSARERGFLEQLLVDPSISRKLLLKTKLPLLVYRLKGYQYF